MAQSFSLALADLVAEFKNLSFKPAVFTEDKEPGAQEHIIYVLMGDINADLAAMGGPKRRAYTLKVQYQTKKATTADVAVANLAAIELAVLGEMHANATRGGNARNTIISGAWKVVKNDRTGFAADSTIVIEISQ
jgi:hypothetical protein